MIRVLWLLCVTVLISSCTIIETTLGRNQKVQVRIWQDHSPDLLTPALDNELIVDIEKENVIDFDIKIVDDTIYLAYTTDKSVKTAKYPTTSVTAGGFLPDGLAASITDTPYDKIHRYTVTETLDQYEARYSRDTGNLTTPNIGSTISLGASGHIKKGVWVRLFKAKISGNPKAGLIWEPLLVSTDPMVITDVKALPLTGNGSVVAISNNNVLTVFNDPDGDGIVNFMHSSLFGRPYNPIRELNTWNDGNDTYLSVMRDSNLITGYFYHGKWIQTYNMPFHEKIEDMSVEMGLNFPYAKWSSGGETHIVVYDKNKPPPDRWLKVDNLSYLKKSQLNVKTSTDFYNGRGEYVFISGIDQSRDFFQLFEIKNLQASYAGPIITSWNERHDFAVNQLGQVLYARVNFDNTLIFAGLNSFVQWDPVQITTPPPVRIHPSSIPEVISISTSYYLIFFKQENGSIYGLAGIS